MNILFGGKGARGMVSRKKRRFVEDGFDLDLSYITKQIVAMGFPSEGMESAFRNPMSQVQEFLRHYHEGHNKVYNLCSEKSYDEKHFEQAQRFGFNDHEAPPFKLLVQFCEEVFEYLKEDPSNVAAIHCKAGKGRTGTVICALLLLAHDAKTGDEALRIFGKARTKNNKGVTIPSQQRYVQYYQRYLTDYVSKGIEFDFDYPVVTLLGFKLSHPPQFDLTGGCDPYFIIYDVVTGEVKYNMKKDKFVKIKNWQKKEPREMRDMRIHLKGDFRIVFYDKDSFDKDDKMFAFTLNTAFLRRNNYKIPRLALDRAVKDKTHRHFVNDFSCEIFFEGVKGAEADQGEIDENNRPFIAKITPADAEQSDSSSDSEEEGGR